MREFTTCQCDECGKEFLRAVSIAKKSNRHYCSRKCRDAANIERMGGPENPLWHGRDVICEECGKPFHIPESRARRRKHHFCSFQCTYAAKQHTMICEECGKPFRIADWRHKRRDTRFCSQVCYASWQSKNRTGPNSYSWRGGPIPYPAGWIETLRKAIRQRDGHKCQLCGRTGGRRALDVHHIDYNKDNLDPKNLVSLCMKCHRATNNNRDAWRFRLTLLVSHSLTVIEGAA